MTTTSIEKLIIQKEMVREMKHKQQLEPSPSGLYRCGKCLDETGDTDGAAYPKRELLRHEHGADAAWPIEWPKNAFPAR